MFIDGVQMITINADYRRTLQAHPHIRSNVLLSLKWDSFYINVRTTTWTRYEHDIAETVGFEPTDLVRSQV